MSKTPRANKGNLKLNLEGFPGVENLPTEDGEKPGGTQQTLNYTEKYFFFEKGLIGSKLTEGDFGLENFKRDLYIKAIKS